MQSNFNFEKFVGAYPLQDCKIFECKKCKQIVFSHFNSGGAVPRSEHFLADYKKDYLAEPAVKSVSLRGDKHDQFINHFDLHNQDKSKNLGFEPIISISDKYQRYLFNYREYDSQNGTHVNFDLVGSRKFLKEASDWLIRNQKVE